MEENTTNLLSRAWRAWCALCGVLALAGMATLALFGAVLPDRDTPVVVVSDFKLLTPTAPANGDFSFQVTRKSNESCGGWGTVVFTSTFLPITIISARFPLVTPGYNSPPPLTVTRPVPRGVTPGRWIVETGVDSHCPTRTRYDVTGKFELGVTDAR